MTNSPSSPVGRTVMLADELSLKRGETMKAETESSGKPMLLTEQSLWNSGCRVQ
jgi:hypothetical protein